MPETIFDVGMNNGDDTAYYLHKGYDVVAVEADPSLCDLARQRFAGAIAEGRLSVLNFGIAPAVGKADFWISSIRSDWNSFDRDGAAKGGGSAHSITVDCMPFGRILETYGVPFYLKIDIEGYDRHCLEDLDPNDLPKFVSIEMSHGEGNRDIEILYELGYRSFHCVRQNDFRSIGPANVDREFWIRNLSVKAPLVGRAINRLRRRPVPDQTWAFPPGSSGPFGADLTAPWLKMEQVFAVWKKLHDQDDALGAGGLGEWFDIHARI